MMLFWGWEWEFFGFFTLEGESAKMSLEVRRPTTADVEHTTVRQRMREARKREGQAKYEESLKRVEALQAAARAGLGVRPTNAQGQVLEGGAPAINKLMDGAFYCCRGDAIGELQSKPEGKAMRSGFRPHPIEAPRLPEAPGSVQPRRDVAVAVVPHSRDDAAQTECPQKDTKGQYMRETISSTNKKDYPHITPAQQAAATPRATTVKLVRADSFEVALQQVNAHPTRHCRARERSRAGKNSASCGKPASHSFVQEPEAQRRRSDHLLAPTNGSEG